MSRLQAAGPTNRVSILDRGLQNFLLNRAQVSSGANSASSPGHHSAYATMALFLVRGSDNFDMPAD